MSTKLKNKPAIEVFYTVLSIQGYGPEIFFYTDKGIVDINQVPFIFLQMNDNYKRIVKSAKSTGSGVIRLYNDDMKIQVRALKHRKYFGFNFPYPFYEKKLLKVR